jgi:hypothetical protein
MIVGVDPNIDFLIFQPVIRLYAVPTTAFTGEEDEDGENFEEEHDSGV